VVGFTHSGDEAPLEEKQAVNKTKIKQRKWCKTKLSNIHLPFLMKWMGAADGDFDVQKYEIDKRNCYCVDLFFYVRELLRHIYTR
jgi:hypothetical protein